MLALALIRLLTDSARALGCEESTYIVGGAPRDCLLGEPVKDIDVVVEDKTGTIGPALAREVARRAGIRNVHPDQYGVVHVGPFPEGFSYHGVDLSRQKIEIVTARREKYDKSLKTGSHKPTTVEPGTIEEDLRRRDFTINTLMWRLSDVPIGDFGFEHIEVTDLLGGRVALEVGVIDTPLDPRETFTEDPSRILRAVRFRAKYGFQYTGPTEDALSEIAPEMRRLPFELLDGVLCDKIIPLPYDKMRSAFDDLHRFGLLPICLEMIPETRLRRVVDALGDIRKEVYLGLFCGFPTSLQKLPAQCRLWLRDASSQHPAETLQRARERFVKPPLDSMLLATEFGLEGRALGGAIQIARELLAEDPFVSQDVLFEKLRTSLRPGV